MTSPVPHNLDHVDAVTAADAAALKRAFLSYGDSWKKRGGVGAFMMLARKWDRLENRLTHPPQVVEEHTDGDFAMKVSQPAFDLYDIFKAILTDQRAEGIINDIRDLRRYLVLVEAELIVQGAALPEEPKDVVVKDDSETADTVPALAIVDQTKSDEYELGKAINEVDQEQTITIHDPVDPTRYKTTLSAEDTHRILRGEPASNFKPQFIDARVSNFMGRKVLEWAEAGDRLVIIHL